MSYNTNLQNNNIDLQSILDTINALPDAGSNTDIEDRFVTQTLSVYENNRVSTIGCAAFYGCSSLTSVSFPICESIDTEGFAYCISLTSVSFPACTSIGINAFIYCSLISASFPACTYIGRSAFASCSNLTSTNFPACTNVGSYAFAYCASLTSVNFPVCASIGGSAFARCSNLTLASFPACSYIGSSAFHYCSSLTTIYLMGSSLCTLSNSNAFYFTGITSTTGSIYVPTSLVTSYKKATNWTYFSNRIFTYEG